MPPATAAQARAPRSPWRKVGPLLLGGEGVAHRQQDHQKEQRREAHRPLIHDEGQDEGGENQAGEKHEGGADFKEPGREEDEGREEEAPLNAGRYGIVDEKPETERRPRRGKLPM